MPKYKLAAPVIESRVVLDLDTGDVVMHYCAVGDDPTESKRASFKLSALTLAALVRDLRNEGIAAGELPARDVAV